MNGQSILSEYMKSECTETSSLNGAERELADGRAGLRPQGLHPTRGVRVGRGANITCAERLVHPEGGTQGGAAAHHVILLFKPEDFGNISRPEELEKRTFEKFKVSIKLEEKVKPFRKF